MNVAGAVAPMFLDVWQRGNCSLPRFMQPTPPFAGRVQQRRVRASYKIRRPFRGSHSAAVYRPLETGSHQIAHQIPFHNPCVPPRSEGTHPRPMRWMGRPRQKLGRQHLACSASALTDSVRGPRRGWLRSDGGSGSMGGPARLSAQPLRGALSGPSAPVAASAAAGRRTARRGGPGSSP
ncbi:unnamed protein product, partial [Prorocentrum cordatum]